MAGTVSDEQRRRLIEANRNEYGDTYSLLNFADQTALSQASAHRQGLLDELAPRTQIGCRDTKLDMRRLSPGCRLCVEGGWSCLFVNGRCNARCFYCPTSQEEVGEPATNTLIFRSPADYVAYLERFGFTGASFSGGEPLLTPERTLAFLGAVKRRFGAGLHTWLYTNASLIDREILIRLRDAGLDEIRVDIGAIGYSLQPVRLAAGLIPTVTVEIPAVPEEAQRLENLLPEMVASGIDHLNLHQMRLTPYNLPRFSTRPYTFLHGEKVTVLESELTALELIRYGHERAIDLPINYCSFVYKNRFQRVAARRRAGDAVKKGYEDLTENGRIRTLALVGDPEDLARQAERFRSGGADADAWALARDRLYFSAALWPQVEFAPFHLRLAYGEATMRESVSYRNAFTEVKLSSGRKVIIERWRVLEMELAGDAIGRFVEIFLIGEPAPADLRQGAGIWTELQSCETVAAGLQEYF